MSQKLPNNLIIAFRYNEQKQHSEELSLYINYLKSLNPKRLLCATSENNPSVSSMQEDGVEVFEYTNYSDIYYSKPILDFYKHANNNHLLIISYGVELEKWQLEHGFDFLRSRNLLCIGWRILQQENDGSYLGRLAYNTCMLHEPFFYDKVVQAGGIPEYVQNGTLGYITVNLAGQATELKIGGQEDLAMQLRLFKSLYSKKHKLFGHITHYGIDYLNQNPIRNHVNYKLMRKVMTAEVYRKVEDINPKDFMDAWCII